MKSVKIYASGEWPDQDNSRWLEDDGAIIAPRKKMSFFTKNFFLIINHFKMYALVF